ncbi:MAG: hypothetical protein K2X04_12260, partial [Burkholderiales bacterium]|nr:hypothetical protein [Burkholderiales bacterium]
LVTVSAIVTGLTGWRKGIGYEEIVEKEKNIDRNVTSKNLDNFRDSLLSRDDSKIIKEKDLSEHLNNARIEGGNLDLSASIDAEISNRKYEGGDKATAIENLNKINVEFDEDLLNFEGFRAKFNNSDLDFSRLRDDFASIGLKMEIRRIDLTSRTGLDSGRKLILGFNKSDKLDGKTEAIRTIVLNELKKVINKDFENRWFKKGRASIAAGVSAVLGTASYFIWKDKFGELGSWVFGGCDKYLCNSTFLYGANSSESAIGMKADAVYQQIPFNDGGKNYIMNVVQVFSQNCDEMIKQSSESQTLVLYAGDSDVNVGKHYLVSDVNNKLCPIGNMDMNEFIESVGAAQ